MAIKVPVIDPSQGASLAPMQAPLGGQNIPAIVGGGSVALARAGEEFGNAVTGVAYNAKQSLDQSAAMSRLSDLGSWKAQTLDGKALQTKGSAALGVSDHGMEAYDDAVNKLAQTLESGDQRKIFFHHVMQDRPLVQKQLIVHEQQQLEVQGEVDFRSGLDRYISDAGLMWKVPGAPETKLALGEKEIADRAKLRKWSDEQAQKEVRDFRSRLVASVVGGSTANPDERGSEYARHFLSRYSTLGVDAQGNVIPDTKGLIDGEVTHKLWQAVRAADTRDVVEQEVGKVQVGVPPNKVTGVADLDAQFTYAAKTIQRGDILEKVRTQLRLIWDQSKANRHEQDKVASSSLINSINESQLKGLLLAPDMVEADPRFQGMTDEGRRAVTDHLLSAQRSVREAYGATNDQQARIRKQKSEAALTGFIDFVLSMPDDKLLALKRNDLAMLFRGPDKDMDPGARANAWRYTEHAQRMANEKLPYKITSYVDDALLRAYPNDSGSRNQLRGPLRRALMDGIISEDVPKKDADIREFLRKTVNNRGFFKGSRISEEERMLEDAVNE